MSFVGIRGYAHRPWANTFVSYPELYIQPESIEQVQSVVRSAANNGVNLVTTGATHSPSKITYTSGWLLNLDKCNSILAEEKYAGYTDVTVEAGIRLKDLNEELAQRNLSLQNLGSISEQSVAGVISTGTHGSSCYHGLISEQVVSVDLVIEDGSIVTASDKINRDLFRGVLLGLGAFGVIVRATLRCVPAFNVESRAYVVGFDELLSENVWNHVFLDAEFHRIWWYPYTNKCYVWQGDKTEKPARPHPYSFYGTRLGRFVYEFLLWVAARFVPGWTPWVEKWLFEHQFEHGTVVQHVGRSDHQINMDCLFKQFVNEWSLPLTEGPKALMELKKEILRKEYYVHAPIEIRASNTTLPESKSLVKEVTEEAISSRHGPVYGNTTRPLLDPSPQLAYAPVKSVTNEQLTLNLNATLYRPFMFDPPVEAWYSDFERICASHGGRPHWAKFFGRNPWGEQPNHELVGEWKNLRDQWSSQKMFGGVDWLKEKGLN